MKKFIVMLSIVFIITGISLIYGSLFQMLSSKYFEFKDSTTSLLIIGGIGFAIFTIGAFIIIKKNLK